MATKHTYIVNRSMHGDGREYGRGDEREMTEADAAPLVANGALTRKGQKTVEREAAVQHTFGTAPSEVNEAGYTTAAGEGIQAPHSPSKTELKATSKKAD